jgi:macrodomain Ter protein organizer (MatP/YcbG family)
MIGSPIFVNSVHSHVDVAPVSSPIRTTCRACDFTNAAIASGLDATVPSRCDQSGIAVTLPKPMTSGIEAKGRFGKQDFVYLRDEDVYRCPAGEKLKYYYTNEEDGQKLRRYWTNACRHCALKHRCTTGVQRRIARWEHEHVSEAVQKRLDENPQAMRQRRETVEHPFGTMKARMGATHFLMKRLPKVATEMALHVLAYNLTRVMNIVGVGPLIAAMRA